ncbi:uncharacterized protein BX663DRAFT_514355 [Cokeromyces recurvatus]|uniref:uncharacterized protein n=1 Tax=Cokeromyces recurvatus TaxID=90255 RepID=UPI00221F3FCC|nr:uncharacterized protein BX663DRAFT_514355 [Cokeromyces recurvatus]KAI7901421.1 hypothetical protein BX663DRAFT_514355 [Cokeromyces recurvatus]
MGLEPEDTQPTVAMDLEPEGTHPTVAMGLEPEDTHPTVAMDIDQHLENIHNKDNVEESEKRNTPESTVQEQNTVHRDSDINKDPESSSGQGVKHRMSAAEFMISDDEDDLIVEKSLYNHLASLSKEANKEKSCIQNKSEEQVEEQTTYEHQNQSDKEEKRIGKRKRSFRDDDDDDDYRSVKERRDSCISEDNVSTSEKEEGLFERTLRLRDISPSTDSSHKKQKTHYADLDNSRSKEDDSEQSRNNKLFIKSIRELKPIVYIPIYGKKKKTSIT